MSERIDEQIVAVPQILEQSVEVIQQIGQEQVSERAVVLLTLEQAVAPAPGIMEGAVAGVRTDSVVPQIMEEILERVQLVYDSPVLQITEEIWESVQLVDVGSPCLRSRRKSWTVCSSWMRVLSCR